MLLKKSCPGLQKIEIAGSARRWKPTVGDADYLGVGNVTGTTTGNVGRFFPDHFAVTRNSPTFNPACTAGSFTYVGQPFAYATAPVLTVTARNASGNPKNLR